MVSSVALPDGSLDERSDEVHATLLRRVEAAVLEAGFTSFSSGWSLARALEHHMGSGGGRFRAALTIDVGLALGVESADVVALASAGELLHNASLLQDDMQDGDTERRGRKAVWVAYGEAVALGLSDVLISGAFASLAQVSDPRAVAQLVQCAQRAVTQTVVGQCADIAARRDPLHAVDPYLDAARNKSGPLIALALELPLIASGHYAALRSANEAALAFAAAYQILDDVNDIARDRATATSPSSLNVVLMLQQHYGLDEARQRALLAAGWQLELSAQASRRLPVGCRAPFQARIDRLERAVSEQKNG